MKIINNEASIEYLDTWSGATATKNTILEHNKTNEFDELIEEIYPEGIEDTRLNDLLWFESDWLFESLGIELEEV